MSPYALTWDDENYYMVAYDAGTESILHYCVDKMTNIAATGEARDGADACRELDMAMYPRKAFGMYSGREERALKSSSCIPESSSR